MEEARPCVFSIKQGLAYFQFDCSEDFGAELNGIFAVTKFAPFPCQYEVSIQNIIISHGTRTCIKRKKIDYGKFFDFCAEKCVYN